MRKCERYRPQDLAQSQGRVDFLRLGKTVVAENAKTSGRTEQAPDLDQELLMKRCATAEYNVRGIVAPKELTCLRR